MAMLLICYMLIEAMEKNRANWKTQGKQSEAQIN